MIIYAIQESQDFLFVCLIVVNFFSQQTLYSETNLFTNVLFRDLQGVGHEDHFGNFFADPELDSLVHLELFHFLDCGCILYLRS